MQLIAQPNAWSCQPAAYSMCMGIDLDTILAVLGHDGGRIDNFNATSVVWTVSCFSQAEMALAAYKLGYAAVEVPATMVSHNGQPIPSYPKTPAALMSVFAPGTRFVLTVQSDNIPRGYHSVAYERDSDVYHDPLYAWARPLSTLKPIKFIAAILRVGVTNGPLFDCHTTTRGFPTSLD